MTTTVQIILAIALTASVILAWVPGIKMTLDDRREARERNRNNDNDPPKKE